MNKNFFVQVECDERTRMLQTDQQLRENLEVIINAFFKTWTAGSTPNVRVTEAQSVTVPVSDAR